MSPGGYGLTTFAWRNFRNDNVFQRDEDGEWSKYGNEDCIDYCGFDHRVVSGSRRLRPDQVRRAPDGSDLVLVQNLNYDLEREVRLRRRARPASVELMDDHGVWHPAGFTWADGIVVIPCDWPCYGVKLFRFK